MKNYALVLEPEELGIKLCSTINQQVQMKSLDKVISKGASSLGKKLRDKNFPTQSRIYKSEQQFARFSTCSPSHSCPLAIEYPLLKDTGEARVVWGQTWG